MRAAFALTWLLVEAGIVVGLLGSANPAAGQDGAAEYLVAGIMVALAAVIPATMVAGLVAWIILMLRFLAPK